MALQILYKIFTSAFFIYILCMTHACVCFDPSAIDETSPDPSTKWVPSCPVERPIYTNRVALPDRPLFPCDLIDVALRSNPLTRQSWYIARSAAFNVGVSESALYPNVTAQESLSFVETNATAGGGGSVTNINPSNDVLNPTDPTGRGREAGRLPGYNQVVTHDLFMTYLLLDFGGRNALIESSRQALYTANWSHNRNIQNIILSVLQAYYGYNNFQGLYQAQQENLKDALTVLESAKAQFEMGVATILDVLQSQSNVANSQLLLESAKGQINISLGQLIKSIGLPANSFIEVAPMPDEILIEDISKDMDILIALAKENRPDLSAAFSNYRQKEAEVVVARSAGLPTLTSTVNLQQTNFIHNPSFNNHVYTGTIALNIPIFDGFLTRNQVRSAKSTAEAAFAAWQDVEANVLLDVVVAYNNYITAVESLKYSDELLKYTQKAYDAALESYQSGVNSILDLLTAQVNLANARAQKIQSKTQLMAGAAALAYATGTL